MLRLVRFGVSLEKNLLTKFDRHIKEKKYHNRSEALRDLIRGELIKTEWLKDKDTAGAIILVYNHHKRELVNKLTEIQHDFHELILSSQHIHLDHDNCLEVIIVNGKSQKLQGLAHRLKSEKGVKFGSLTAATKGANLS